MGKDRMVRECGANLRSIASVGLGVYDVITSVIDRGAECVV